MPASAAGCVVDGDLLPLTVATVGSATTVAVVMLASVSGPNPVVGHSVSIQPYGRGMPVHSVVTGWSVTVTIGLDVGAVVAGCVGAGAVTEMSRLRWSGFGCDWPMRAVVPFA